MRVAGGSTARALCENMIDLSGNDRVNLDIRRFPDGDLFVCCNEDLDGETVVVVQSPFKDEGIIEHRLIQDACQNAGADKMISIAPYMSYSRQDKHFNKGEAVSALPISRLLGEGCDEIYFIDMHNPEVITGNNGSRNVIPARSFAKYLEEYSDGRVEAQLFYNGSTGGEKETVQPVKLNSAQAAHTEAAHGTLGKAGERPLGSMTHG